jgi:PAS domain S-box-containing protein
MANADGWIYWFNRRWYDYTGTTPEAMLGWGWQSVHDPDMLPLIVEKWTAALASGTVFEMIFPLRGIDGVLRPFLTRIVPLRDADGVITRWFGNNVDISEQQASEAALRESEARFRVLADSMPQMVWSALPDGFHDYYNARWYEFTGVPSGSTDGEGWNGMFHADDQARANARWRHSLATGEPYEIEYRLRRHDGVYRWTLGRALPLLDETGRITRWVGTCTDIDDTKQVAEMLARNRLELERLVEERTAALLREVDERRKAEEALHQGEKLQAIGQLTGGIAHDFNNILQVVTSGATLLSRPSLTEERRTVVLAGMKNAAQSAKDLTGRLLAFARKQSLKPKVFDLNSRLFGMSELLRHTLGSRIRVETSLADDLWLALADPGQLEVAILNLAMNARDAMLPKGGVLRFETHNASLDASLDRAEGDYVCLVVRDTGTGMPDSVLARVFEPFFTTKGLGRGTGLGLAQVHGFSKQSGGDIAIESTQGEGTVITLHLPRAAGVELESLPSATSRDVASVHPMQVASGRTVLVVEDNADVAAFAAGMLEGIGYKTRHAANAADALMLLESGVTLDAVFTDVMMPGELNGVQLAVMIRARFPALAVVLASGYSEAGLEWGSEAVGELLDKPYRLDELEQALERAFIASADRNFFRSST